MLQTKKEKTWFLCTKPLMYPKLRLFCFPYAGGGSSTFRGWEKGLSNGIEMHAAQLPGREKRFMDAPCKSIDELVEHMSEAFLTFLDTPFAFFGHSMGALIAYELARKLHMKYGVPPIHLFVSGKGAPQLEVNNTKLYNLPRVEFFQKLSDLNGTPREVLENQELMELYEMILRADFEACETYQFREGLPLECSVSVFGGLQDHKIHKSDLEAWKEVVCGNIDVFMYEGDHFFINQHRDLILNNINQALLFSVK